MNFQRLKYFLTLAKTKNFTVAANELHISQPALSKQIALFEDELNTRLINRNTKSFKLTFAGELLEKEGSELLKFDSEILHHLKIAGKVETFPLSIGFSTTGITDTLNKIVSEYRKKNPDIIIDLKRVGPTTLYNNLKTGTLMLGIARLEDLRILDSFKYKIINTSRLAIVCKDTNWIAKKDIIKLNEIKDEPIVMMRALHENKDAHHDFINICARYNFKPNIINECDLIETLFLMIDSCDYITLLSDDLENTLPPGLVIRPLENAPLLYTAVLWNKTNDSIPYVQDFIDDLICESKKETEN